MSWLSSHLNLIEGSSSDEADPTPLVSNAPKRGTRWMVSIEDILKSEEKKAKIHGNS